MLVALAPVVNEYLTGLVVQGRVHERRLMRRIAEVELNLLLLSVFFPLVRYCAVRHLPYEPRLVHCHGYGLLL